MQAPLFRLIFLLFPSHSSHGPFYKLSPFFESNPYTFFDISTITPYRATNQREMNFRIPKEPLLPQKQSVGVRSLSPSPSPPPQSRWRLVFLLFPFFVFSIFIYGSSHLKRSFSSTLLSSPRHQPPIIPPWHLIEPSSESSHLLFPPSPAIPCPSLNSLDISTRYNYIKNTSGRTLLALNLYNSEHVLPSLSRLILELAEFLGKEKIAVVVFENGSKDSTKTLLGNLRRKLEQVEVRNLIWSSVYSTDWTVSVLTFVFQV